MPIRVVAQRYELESEIGRGGMAVVYRARDMRLNRLVALKLLHPYLATQAESAARFLRESEAIAKLHHPNIVEIFDAGSDEETGSQFLVMELVEGPTLAKFIEKHATRIPEIAVAMLCCLCDAVEHAHKVGIIHRDIKPENIMFSRDGQLKLMDFGIARILDADRMTASGSLIGSPAHMPPEIIEGQRYSFTCDIFSLGTVLYYALTQVLPFTGTTPIAVFKAILEGNYQAPSRVSQTVTKQIDKTVAKCLKKAPADRYQSVGELRSALLEILGTVKFEAYSNLVPRYFSDPDLFFEKNLPSVKASILSAAQWAVRDRRLPYAFECLNCILAYDPNDLPANAMLRRLRTGSAIKKHVLVVSGIVAGIVCLCLLGWFLWSNVLAEPSEGVEASLALSSESSVEVALPEVVETEPVVPKSGSTVASRGWREFQDKLWFAMTRLMAVGVTGVDASDPSVAGEEIYDDDLFLVIGDEFYDESALEALQPEHRKSRRGHRIRTPKKPTVQTANMGTGQVANAVAPSGTVANGSTAGVSGSTAGVSGSTAGVSGSAAGVGTQGTGSVPSLVKLTQPVYPPDGYAVIAGRRYEANSSGDIELMLAPGNYRMMLTCSQRCVRQTIELKVDASVQGKTLEVVSLDWADATLSLTGPTDRDLYYVARRLDDRSQRVFHLVPWTPNAVNGFNAFGKPIQLEVYAIPTSNTLKSYDSKALEAAKYASTRVALSPGETRTIGF